MEAYIVQKESLETVADSIRAKAGISGKLEFPLGWKAAVENISGGSAPDGSAVTFGYETRTETTQAPTGKAWFNGVLLPEIPEDVLAEYPYAFIHKYSTRYNLVFSKTKYWYRASDNTAQSGDWIVKNYWLTFEDLAAGQTWSYRNDTGYYWEDFSTSILWSNYDIPNGSATATGIYFKGSEPVTEIKTTTSVPVEREEQYAIASADLNELGAVTQKMAGKRALMTVADMVYWLNRVQFIPQGNAEGDGFGISFATRPAEGVLPVVYKGNTESSGFALGFTASAFGA